jgi:HEAT repeat protein
VTEPAEQPSAPMPDELAKLGETVDAKAYEPPKLPGLVRPGFIVALATAVVVTGAAVWHYRHEQELNTSPPALIQKLVNGRDYSTREQAARRLGYLCRRMGKGSAEAVPALAEAAVSDRDGTLAETCVWALVMIRDPKTYSSAPILLKSLKSDNLLMRQRAAAASSEVAEFAKDPAAAEALIGALQDKDITVREYATVALAAMGDPGSFGPLMQALEDTAPAVRWNAAAGLGQMKDARAIPLLLSAMKDQDDRVRSAAQTALLCFAGDSKVADYFLAALTDKAPHIRSMAVFMLERVDGKYSVVALIGALEDKNDIVRGDAVRALGGLGDARAVAPLVEALRNDKWCMIRQWAAYALGQIGSPQATEGLQAALKDEDEIVRAAAAEALKKIRGEDAGK